MTSGVLASYLADPHSAVAPPIFAADQFGEMRSSVPDRQLDVYRTQPRQISVWSSACSFPVVSTNGYE